MSLITVDPHNIEVHVGGEKFEPQQVDITIDVETGDIKTVSDAASDAAIAHAVGDAIHAKVAELLHVDADFGVPWFGLSNAPDLPPMGNLTVDRVLAQMRRAQQEWLERIQLRKQALVNLWKHAVSQVRVRHPDPKVQVRVDVRDGIGEEVRLDFVMLNICDTSFDSERRMWRFRHGATLVEWPGLENAKMWISAAWALYLQHEAFELVTLRDRAGCNYHDGYIEGCSECAENAAIIDAHGNGHHQSLLRDTGDVKKTLQWAIGDAWAVALLDADAARAKQDLDNEMAWVKEPWVCC